MRDLALRVVRLALYVGATLPVMPLQALLVLLGSRWAIALPLAYHRLCCRLLGFRLELRGQRSNQHPTLFVANHTSYLDITILGAVIPGSFVAKAEVGTWPFFGWLAKLQRTVFIDRKVRSTAAQREAMAARLEAGDHLILFPEGTSSDGTRVLPFKSALFSAAEFEHEGVPLAVQPVSVAYTRLDGIPIGRALRPFFAWYGDMDLAPHMWHLLGLGVVTVVVEFHPVVTLRELGSRKALAEHCQRAVSAGVAAAHSGRLQQKLPKAAPVAEAAQVAV